MHSHDMKRMKYS